MAINQPRTGTSYVNGSDAVDVCARATRAKREQRALRKRRPFLATSAKGGSSLRLGRSCSLFVIGGAGVGFDFGIGRLLRGVGWHIRRYHRCGNGLVRIGVWGRRGCVSHNVLVWFEIGGYRSLAAIVPATPAVELKDANTVASPAGSFTPTLGLDTGKRQPRNILRDC